MSTNVLVVRNIHEHKLKEHVKAGMDKAAFKERISVYNLSHCSENGTKLTESDTSEIKCKV